MSEPRDIARKGKAGRDYNYGIAAFMEVREVGWYRSSGACLKKILYTTGK